MKMTRAGVLLLAVVCLLLCSAARADWPQVVRSHDGTPISFEVHGSGEPALVFVHGWSCDGRYWREQVPYFAAKYRVVTLDLAGHGHSGAGRSRYSMRAFGEDVRAVVDAVGSAEVILIGHSMGGSVIAEAARLLPKRVRGLVGVDTLENIEYPLTQKELDAMVGPLEGDFALGVSQFVADMISPRTDPRLRDWIITDMAAAPPPVALSAMRELMAQYLTGEAAKIFEDIRVPVYVVNGSLWPINYEANRRHMRSFDAVVLTDADHFLMLNRVQEFNLALERTVESIVAGAGRSMPTESVGD